MVRSFSEYLRIHRDGKSIVAEIETKRPRRHGGGGRQAKRGRQRSKDRERHRINGRLYGYIG